MTDVDRRLFSYEDFVLYESDARSVDDANWLTDNVVNFAVSYLYNQTVGLDPLIRDKVSVIYATLCELIKYTPTDGQQMDALLESVGASPHKWLLFLFNNSTEPQIALSGSHWSLVLFNPNRKQFILFDPMKAHGKPSPTGNASDVYRFVLKLAVSFGCPPSEQLFVSSVDHPIMRVAGDCGIYVVEYARAILKALTLSGKKESESVSFDFSHIKSDGDIGSIRRSWMELIKEQTANRIDN